MDGGRGEPGRAAANGQWLQALRHATARAAPWPAASTTPPPRWLTLPTAGSGPCATAAHPPPPAQPSRDQTWAWRPGSSSCPAQHVVPLEAVPCVSGAAAGMWDGRSGGQPRVRRAGVLAGRLVAVGLASGRCHMACLHLRHTHLQVVLAAHAQVCIAGAGPVAARRRALHRPPLLLRHLLRLLRRQRGAQRCHLHRAAAAAAGGIIGRRAARQGIHKLCVCCCQRGGSGHPVQLAQLVGAALGHRRQPVQGAAGEVLEVLAAPPRVREESGGAAWQRRRAGRPDVRILVGVLPPAACCRQHDPGAQAPAARGAGAAARGAGAAASTRAPRHAAWGGAAAVVVASLCRLLRCIPHRVRAHHEAALLHLQHSTEGGRAGRRVGRGGCGPTQRWCSVPGDPRLPPRPAQLLSPRAEPIKDRQPPTLSLSMTTESSMGSSQARSSVSASGRPTRRSRLPRLSQPPRSTFITRVTRHSWEGPPPAGRGTGHDQRQRSMSSRGALLPVLPPRSKQASASRQPLPTPTCVAWQQRGEGEARRLYARPHRRLPAAAAGGGGQGHRPPQPSAPALALGRRCIPAPAQASVQRPPAPSPSHLSVLPGTGRALRWLVDWYRTM